MDKFISAARKAAAELNVVFTLQVLTVRDATDEETRAGQAVVAGADVPPSLMRPV